ncbi:MAG: TonB-dependent receptor [Gemmatimonadetes bacterium]|nr:TonB-dependent receptor [Gemmatimonadota bacterium]
MLHRCALVALAMGTASATITAQGAKKPVKTPAKPAVPIAAPLVAPAVAAEPEPIAPQVAMIAGVIEDSLGAPIIDAEIAILGTSLRTRSSTGGTWRIGGIEPGPVLLSARRVGYLPQTITVHVKSGESRAMDLTMQPMSKAPFQLPEQVIFTTPRPMRSVFHGAFYQRKATYPGGTFYTREDILQLKAVYTSDVFRTTPGFYQSRDRRGQTQWVVRGVTTAQACPIRFFIDGVNVPLNGMSIDELVQPSDIEGIEIYKGLSTVPAEFSGRSNQDDSRCGVVAVWTRVTR